MDVTHTTHTNQGENADKVSCPTCSKFFKRKGLQRHINSAHSAQHSSPERNSTQLSSQQQPTQVSLLEEAFGSPFLNNVGSNTGIWQTRWNKVCTLRGKLYDLPASSTSSRKFIHTLADEIELLTNSQYPSERVLIFIAVMLQRDKNVKQAKDINRLLERRLNLWANEHFEILLTESMKSDNSLRNSHNRKEHNNHVTQTFTRLILRGKIREAVNWLLTNDTSKVLNTNHEVDATGKTVSDVLKDKHPLPKTPNADLFTLPDEVLELPPLLEVDITSNHVEQVARKLHGGGGPTGTTSENWKDYLLRFGEASHHLRNSIAQLTMTLNNEYVPWHQIQALMSSRLVALDKCPGVRPIGIGECLRRIISKCMILATGSEVTEACGQSQLCSGLSSGIEGAIHAMNNLYQDKCYPGSNWGMILVDANNAFNSVNRQLALWQARIYWPHCARFLYNTYNGHAELVIRDSDIRLYSKEGVTQGDPLAMPLYALATLPIINKMKKEQKTIQSWYADDSSAQGDLNSLRNWWDKINTIGPSFGYFPQAKKTLLVVSETDKETAHKIFKGTNITIVTGSRFLGSYIGDGNEDFIKNKVNKFVSTVEKISQICKDSPQAAYTALTKAIQFQWSFLLRVLNNSHEFFEPLTHALRTIFLPTLFGSDVSPIEADLFSLPVHKGGLAISDPFNATNMHYEMSRNGCKALTMALIDQKQIVLSDHNTSLKEARKEGRKEKQARDDTLLETTLAKFTANKKRAIERSIASKMKSKSSNWLSVIPTKKDHFDLSPTEFRDALAIRYHRIPNSMPQSCDGCGNSYFNIDHALCCKTGGLITRRHNEIRDLFCELCQHAWGNVTKEPLISQNDCGLRADLSCRGVWVAQREALFDIRVVDTDAPSYLPHPVTTILKSAEKEKQRKYSNACEMQHVTFTPLVTSVDGVFAPQMSSFIKHMAEKISERWNRSLSTILGWLRARIGIAIIRATSMCIRGTRHRFKPVARWLGFDDGAALPPHLD
jgi:uncharacterized C2H2 Zn-finger protein